MQYNSSIEKKERVTEVFASAADNFLLLSLFSVLFVSQGELSHIPSSLTARNSNVLAAETLSD